MTPETLFTAAAGIAAASLVAQTRLAPASGRRRSRRDNARLTASQIDQAAAIAHGYKVAAATAAPGLHAFAAATELRLWLIGQGQDDAAAWLAEAQSAMRTPPVGIDPYPPADAVAALVTAACLLACLDRYGVQLRDLGDETSAVRYADVPAALIAAQVLPALPGGPRLTGFRTNWTVQLPTGELLPAAVEHGGQDFDNSEGHCHD